MRCALALLLLPLTAACATTPPPADQALAEVARVHGAAGPWAVAGYRMGQYALGKLGLKAQSFDLEVVHHSPRQFEYTCIADGASAATGASVGKLNLQRVDSEIGETVTEYRRRSTGQAVVLKPAPAFVARFAHAKGNFDKLGHEVLAIPDKEVFEETTLVK